MKKWIVLTAVLIMMLQPSALAENEAPATSPAPSGTAKPLIPETVDVGRWNDFNPLEYWPWQSLTVTLRENPQEPVFLDILVEDDGVANPWQGVNDQRLEEEGLNRQSLAPLLEAVPQGWGGLLTKRHELGYVEGTIAIQKDGWYFERALPQRFRLVVYLPQRGKVFVTPVLQTRQYHALVQMDIESGQAAVLQNTRALSWRMKLMLRLALSAALTVLAVMPLLDRGRRWVFFLKLLSGALYFLLVMVSPGLFARHYPWAMALLQLLLSGLEAWVVYRYLAGGNRRTAVIYGGLSFALSAAVGLWWGC